VLGCLGAWVLGWLSDWVGGWVVNKRANPEYSYRINLARAFKSGQIIKHSISVAHEFTKPLSDRNVTNLYFAGGWLRSASGLSRKRVCVTCTRERTNAMSTTGNPICSNHGLITSPMSTPSGDSYKDKR